MLRFLAPLVLGAALISVGCRRAAVPAEDDDDGGGGSGVGGAGVGGTGGRPEPLPLTVLNWNARNVFNDVIDSGAPKEVTDPNWDQKRSRVGIVLAALDADIVVLQEIEHQAVLAEINDLELGGRYPEVHVIEGNDPRGIDVGLLSKLPLHAVITHRDDEFVRVGGDATTYRYSRDCLEVRLTFNGRPLALLGVHYRAKTDDDPDKRLAEAQRTRAIADAITAESPSNAVIILGDFNDVPGSPPYTWTIGQDPLLYRNAADLVPEGDRWTFNFDGSLELIDQQMHSPLLGPMLESASIVHSADVSSASDHAPVVATYLVN
jgi:endonuclease/exonuclease/phosphatase family metal-dependent hydrolase